MAPQKDFYEILGVEESANQDAIRKAYRKLARENHPDVNTDNPDAHEKFIELSQAYEVLSDPGRRAKYDAARQTDSASAPPSQASSPKNQSGWEEILNFVFGGMNLGEFDQYFDDSTSAAERQRMVEETLQRVKEKDNLFKEIDNLIKSGDPEKQKSGLEKANDLIDKFELIDGRKVLEWCLAGSESPVMLVQGRVCQFLQNSLISGCIPSYKPTELRQVIQNVLNSKNGVIQRRMARVIISAIDKDLFTRFRGADSLAEFYNSFAPEILDSDEVNAFVEKCKEIGVKLESRSEPAVSQPESAPDDLDAPQDIIESEEGDAEEELDSTSWQAAPDDPDVTQTALDPEGDELTIDFEGGQAQEPEPEYFCCANYDDLVGNCAKMAVRVSINNRRDFNSRMAQIFELTYNGDLNNDEIMEKLQELQIGNHPYAVEKENGQTRLCISAFDSSGIFKNFEDPAAIDIIHTPRSYDQFIAVAASDAASIICGLEGLANAGCVKHLEINYHSSAPTLTVALSNGRSKRDCWNDEAYEALSPEERASLITYGKDFIASSDAKSEAVKQIIHDAARLYESGRWPSIKISADSMDDDGFKSLCLALNEARLPLDPETHRQALDRGVRFETGTVNDRSLKPASQNKDRERRGSTAPTGRIGANRTNSGLRAAFNNRLGGKRNTPPPDSNTLVL